MTVNTITLNANDSTIQQSHAESWLFGHIVLEFMDDNRKGGQQN
jgi:hypothetical protein